MLQHESDFLVAEFEQAWAMILNIDERRFKFIEYYSALFTAVAAVGTSVITWRGTVDIDVAGALTALIFMAIVVGLAFKSLLESERRANVRYRKKINHIRSIFLEAGRDPLIVAYMARKDIGIKTAADAEQPEGRGQTLKLVIRFLHLEMGFLLSAVAVMWAIAILNR